MRPRNRLRRRTTLAAAATTFGLLVAGLAFGPVPAQAEPAPESNPAVTVMTRNLYLGADIQRPIEAIVGETNPQLALLKLANATYVTRAIVDQTDFDTRSRLLANEIAAAAPDLVGLQEVALWRSGPLQLDPADVAVPNAPTVDYDFLEMLLTALDEAGTPYRAVSVNTLSDVEAPSFAGYPPSADAKDVRLTMRDVILRRADSDVRVVDAQVRDYETNFAIPPIAGKSLDFTRGYQWVDAKVLGKKFRFVNTHLEAFSSDIAYAQMQEMLEGPATHKRSTIIACDCNSDPLNSSIKPHDTLPHSAPYQLATVGHAFWDTWLQHAAAHQGWTSGLNELVNEPANEDGWPIQGAGTAGEKISWTHRIDLVLAKDAKGGQLEVLDGEVTGRLVGSRFLDGVDTGLRPSDHAGVVMTLRGL